MLAPHAKLRASDQHKNAKALGLAIPQSILVRADRVIELDRERPLSGSATGSNGSMDARHRQLCPHCGPHQPPWIATLRSDERRRFPSRSRCIVHPAQTTEDATWIQYLKR
jgi:hypothetical protein